MFGGRNRLSSEQIRQMQSQLEYNEEYFQRIADAKDIFDANRSETQNSREQMDKEILQVGDNIVTVLSYASQNIEAQKELLQELGDYEQQVKGVEQSFGQVTEMVRQQAMDSQMLVEGNKHFTSPSKYLTEVPEELRRQNSYYEEVLKQMAEYCKQMSVMTLNAAIEAGRMGEAGMSFVSASEEVRNLSVAYNGMIQQMRQLLMESETKIALMEEKFQQLIALLKDNNVATGKLMKQCNDTAKFIEKTSIHTLSEGMSPFRDQIIGLKNVEEEIVKAEERNRMQMSDIREEMVAQQKNENEIIDLLNPIFMGEA